MEIFVGCRLKASGQGVIFVKNDSPKPKSWEMALKLGDMLQNKWKESQEKAREKTRDIWYDPWLYPEIVEGKAVKT